MNKYLQVECSRCGYLGAKFQQDAYGAEMSCLGCGKVAYVDEGKLKALAELRAEVALIPVDGRGRPRKGV